MHPDPTEGLSSTEQSVSRNSADHTSSNNATLASSDPSDFILFDDQAMPMEPTVTDPRRSWQPHDFHTTPTDGYLYEASPVVNPGDLVDEHGLRQPTDVLISVRRKLRRFHRQADRTVLKQFEVAHEEQGLENCRNALEDLTDFLRERIAGVASGEPGQARPALLENIEGEIRDCHATFRAQSQRLSGMRADLIELQDRLTIKAEKLAEWLDTLELSLPGPIARQLGGLESGSESSTKSLQPPAPVETSPLLLAYYHRKGDVRILQERLIDLELQHQDDLLDRDLISDRGDQLDVPDDEFERQYASQRKTLSEEINVAQQETDVLADQCEAAGLNPYEDEYASEAGSESPTREIHGPLPMSGSHILLDEGWNQGNAPYRAVPAAQSSRTRREVRGWLEGVDSDPQTPSSDVEASHHEAATPKLAPEEQKND